MFSEGHIDNALKSSTDGGYVLSRPRYTRSPLRKFTTGFSDLTEAEKESLLTFFNTYGTYQIFQYTHPITAVQYDVRFEAPPLPKYIGRGGFHFWVVSNIVLVEA